jgi:hypothetical protein
MVVFKISQVVPIFLENMGVFRWVKQMPGILAGKLEH